MRRAGGRAAIGSVHAGEAEEGLVVRRVRDLMVERIARGSIW
jgi:hypothetical protein